MSMKLRKPRHLAWFIASILVVAAVTFALWPKPIVVEQVVISTQVFESTIEADGIVQARGRFSISMPTTGILERLDIEPGQPVRAGQVIGHVIPPDIDARQRQQAQAHVRSLESALAELDQQMASLRPLLEQSSRRSDRLERLGVAGAVSREQVENARDAFTQMTHQLEALRSRQQSARYELQSARSVLSARPGQRVPLTSPADGIVLRRYEQSERTVLAGTPIMEIGDTSSMEVVIDVLSTDAVKVSPGMPVHLDGWGGGSRLRGMVRRIEPAARTKVSSLGIEEQRVNVIADVLDRPTALGDGYRVEASIVTQHIDNALCLPLGALVRRGEEWSVFVNDRGTASLRPVSLGLRNALVASVLKGLQPGQHVLLHPPETLRDGDRIQ